MIDYPCPSCHVVLESPESFAGRRVACPACAAPLTVPPPTRVFVRVGRPEPARPASGWEVRCYRCGTVVAAEDAYRRDVVAHKGAAFSGSPFDLGNWIFGGATSRVDLCGDCAAAHDAARARLRRWLLAGLVVLAVFLLAAVLWAAVLSQSFNAPGRPRRSRVGEAPAPACRQVEPRAVVVREEAAHEVGRLVGG